MSVKPSRPSWRANTFVQLSVSLTHAPLRSSASARPMDTSMSPIARLNTAGFDKKTIVIIPSSMTGQDQRLDRQYQRLDAQQHRMHEADAVHHMQGDLPAGRRILGR